MAKCGCTTPGSFSACAGFPLFFGTAEGPHGEWASYYAQKVGATFGKDNSSTCSPYSFVVGCVLSHRLPFYKEAPGDCPKDTKTDISGSGTTKALGIAGSAAGLTSGAIGIATGVTGSSALAAGGVAALGAIAGIASLGVGLLAVPFAILAHHSQAVALENEVLCAVSSAYNNYADQIEAALKAGSLSLAQANDIADKMNDQVQQALKQGMKTCNARCYYNYAIQALTLFCKERFFPTLVSTAQAPTASATEAQSKAKVAGVAAAGIALASGHPYLAIGAGLLALKGGS